MRRFAQRTLVAVVAALLAATPLVGADRLCKLNAMCTPNLAAGAFPNGGMAPPLVEVSGAQWESKCASSPSDDRMHALIQYMADPLISSISLCSYTVDGWDVYKERVQLNGLSTVAGWPTPTDTDVPPLCPCPNDDCQLSGDFYFDATIENALPPPTGSDTYIDFFSSGSIIDGYVRKRASECPLRLVCFTSMCVCTLYFLSPFHSCACFEKQTHNIMCQQTCIQCTYTNKGIVHGPYIVSKNAIKITQGAAVSFDWYASDDEDMFDVFGYLLNVRLQTHACATVVTGHDRNHPRATYLPSCCLHFAGGDRQHHHPPERIWRLD